MSGSFWKNTSNTHYTMNKRLLISWFAVLLCPATVVYPQNTGSQRWESVLETLVSDEELSSAAQEELSLMYESLHEMPLNINTATREELMQLPFLTDSQIEDIHAYIYVHGPMLTLGELQLTGSLDYNTRQLLSEFVYAGDAPQGKEKVKLSQVLSQGRNEAVARADIPLYKRDGFRYHSPQELERYPNRAYMGNRYSHSFRYSFNWHNRIRFGLSADKDAGEPFLGRNRAGYDFYSPYLYLKDMGVLRELAVGRYKAQFGLGLLIGGGFSVGKNMALTSMNRQSQGLKPHSSTQEYGYLQGAGIAAGKSHTTFTLMVANTSLDATLTGDTVIKSFKEDGYHRTALEWSKKHNVKLGTLAANVRYSFRGLRAGGTLLAEKLSMPYNGKERFLGLSADFGLNRGRYSVATEFSLMDCKAAVIASQTMRLNADWTLNMVFRHYSPGYMSLHSNAMAESDVCNETGILTGFTHSRRNLKLSGYADLFMYPEPRYGASDRSNGMDLRAEADWKAGRRDALYATARFKSKQKDCKYTGQLEYCLTGRYRLRWTHNCRSGAELKTQLFYVRYDFIAEPISNGFALTQSYSRSLFKERLDMNITAAVFSTDSYDSRISVYENGLRYSYNFMSLYGKGGRLSATVRFKVSRNMQLNLKAGGTYYLDRKEISSAQQRIDSCHKEDLSVQLITKF